MKERSRIACRASPSILWHSVPETKKPAPAMEPERACLRTVTRQFRGARATAAEDSWKSFDQPVSANPIDGRRLGGGRIVSGRDNELEVLMKLEPLLREIAANTKDGDGVDQGVE